MIICGQLLQPARELLGGRDMPTFRRGVHMRRSIVVVLAVTFFAGLNGCGRDEAIELVRRSEMQAVARASFEVRPSDEKAFAGYFRRDGKYLSIGEVMSSVRDGGRDRWESRMLTDAVREVEVDIVPAIVETPIKVSFRVNVETGEVTIDGLTIKHATGGLTTGMGFDQYGELDTYMRIGAR